MATYPSDIEEIPGFMDWFVGEPAASRGEPAESVEVHGFGCSFSRSLTEEERAEVLDFLRSHVDPYKEYRLIGTLSLPLAEISMERIDEIRTVARGIEVAGGHGGRWLSLESRVILCFGTRREAAEKKLETLGPRVYGRRIVDSDGECLLIGQLQIPLREDLGTSAEVERYIALARKEIGDDEFEAPPRFLAELSMLFDERAAAEAMRPRFGAIGLGTKVVEEIHKMVRSTVVAWQQAWLVTSGRVEELMRPGVLSTAGFLGEAERLGDVLKEDASTLAALGVTPADVAGRIREIVRAALGSRKREWEEGGDVIGRFRVRLRHWGGYQRCPWLCTSNTAWGSFDFMIENRRTGAKLEGPGLIVHLIAEHGFFEGKESPYRVDPRHAAEVLGLPRTFWDRLLRR
ncbi:hypothetical protein [Polyangium jinanense]|uniref:Uncharacterized protein n=1 Tax=Polyangium jinanense TaxID=2829994 RepID=A0A9X4APA7_9BACT|nr:hypothetical protein [Polyangium jinanense]MDC3979808.1 hypothetical protein [Polyangium jinanense]